MPIGKRQYVLSGSGVAVGTGIQPSLRGRAKERSRVLVCRSVGVTVTAVKGPCL